MRAKPSMWTRHCSNSAKLGILALLAASAAFSAAASAQEAATTGRTPLSCNVAPDPVDASQTLVSRSTEMEPDALVVVCGETGLSLGPVENYRTLQNVPDDILLIDLQRHGHRSVYMLTVDENGQAVVEDLTVTLATAAGLSPTSRIDGLAIVYSRFASHGEMP